jgi:hypothetical protein
MNILLKTSAAVAMVAGLAAPAFGQTVSANGTGNAGIVAPLSITAGNTLEFGTVVRPAAGGSGTVTINATTGAPSYTGGVYAVSGGTAARRGTFSVLGEGTRAFTTTVGTLTLTSGGNTIPVTLTSDAPTALTSGAATIGIGGSFTLSDTQATGSYTGQYSVSVAYN